MALKFILVVIWDGTIGIDEADMVGCFMFRVGRRSLHVVEGGVSCLGVLVLSFEAVAGPGIYGGKVACGVMGECKVGESSLFDFPSAAMLLLR